MVWQGDLLRLAETLAKTVIQRHKRYKRKTRLISINLETAGDATPVLSCYHGLIASTIADRYLPQAGFLTCAAEP